MQTITVCPVEVAVQYRGTRARLLQEATRQGIGLEDQTINRFIAHDLKCLGCNTQNAKINCSQNGVRIFWELQSSSRGLELFSAWAKNSLDVDLHKQMSANEMAFLFIRINGTTVRKLLCKADGNFQRADRRTLDLLPLNPQALPSNQVAKRTHEDMSAAGGNSLNEVSTIPTSPTGPSPKRVKHSPPNPTAFDAWGGRLGAPTAYVPIQPARPVTISNSAAMTTGVAPTPTSFVNTATSQSVPKTPQEHPAMRVTLEQILAEYKKERAMRVKAEAELKAEREERIRLQQLLESGSSTDAGDESASDSSTTVKSPEPTPVTAKPSVASIMPPSNKQIEPAATDTATSAEDAVDVIKEKDDPFVLPAILEAFSRISQLTNALGLKS